ncbi:hypothetical protein CFOL_v3_07777 [Cephalotus follicularis]|uniref:Uncharacterized protein n=1 Tax=Cephalotus follicularis TaxID=3775 RepID=A0A1Q3B8K7_CEPFO|nr:hypothetical protein CFOL_v3_07777 [Cephalotus follicularis]
MLLEKTYRTFHASNMLLQQQYRLHGFTKYRELIGSFLIAEQNNELLLQNHESRPTGSAPLPEVNCGMEGHWCRACRTAKHWVDLYQASLKENDKRIETNFIGHCDPLKTTQSNFDSMGITHLDIADFVTNPNEKMNQVIVDEDFHLG